VSTDGAAAALLQATLQRDRVRLVALLARGLGLPQLGLAEDAVQTAALRALEHWPRDGPPQQPAAWLHRVARHAAIDVLRRDRPLDALDALDDGHATAQALATPAPAAERFAGELGDDELALLFVCCHPALPEAGQLALALHLFTGLAHGPLAAALLCSEPALAQRLQRARDTLARLPDRRALRVPSAHELPPRRDAVLSVLALAFHTGTRARLRGEPEALALCWESIRLARAIAQHPAAGHADGHALAAMLLLHGARLNGAVDEAGDIVWLPGQARERWDAGMVRMGFVHLRAAQRTTRLSRWHLLAGIAAEHAAAPDHASTDWAAIVGFYDQLLRIDGSPAPRLGHAIALAEAGDSARALALLLSLAPQLPPALQAHHAAALARAYEQQGDMAAACEALARAVALAEPRSPAEARALTRRLQRLRGEPGGSPPA
jgi:RNA polymerase sigma-70 factor, ECF subfamily